MHDIVKFGDYHRDAFYQPHMGIALTALISKLIFSIGLLLQDIGRLVIGAFNFLNSKEPSYQYLEKESTKTPIEIRDSVIKKESVIPSRRKFLTLLATGIASIPLGALWYGQTKGKYHYIVKKVSLSFKDLPQSFDGFTIAQFSDLHAGGLDDAEEVRKGIQIINEQQADLILFTGDLVNSDKKEVNPYISILAELKATYGKYAVLGNHDYHGAPPDSHPKSKSYWSDFYQKFQQMGFTLLNNTHVPLQREGAQIRLLGVENWGIAEHWFPRKADLNKALEGCATDDFCILMSHDPVHWDHKILPHPKKFHLTLSGHTHGAQFGLDLPQFKWSPIKYRYKRWMGLYEEAEQYLYVNRGFGYSVFPGRVGMWPEITVIELLREV